MRESDAGATAEAEAEVSWLCVWRSLLAVLWFCVCATVQAIPADISLSQLHHTRWTLADGAPGNVRALAQTPDGALWLGGEAGLYRFDGFQFVRFSGVGLEAKPLSNVISLKVTRDGALWVGLQFGGAYRLKGNQLQFHGDALGLPADRGLFDFAEASDGSLWASTTQGVFRLFEGRWHPAPVPELTKSFVDDLHFDRKGQLWAIGIDGLFVVKKGESRAHRLALHPSRGSVAEQADGSIWFIPGMDDFRVPSGVMRLSLDEEHLPIGERTGLRLSRYGGTLTFDREGSLWIGRLAGIVRVSHPDKLGSFGDEKWPSEARAQVLGQEHGLSGEPIRVFEDRDGSIWVSTTQGIDRFRVPRVLPLPLQSPWRTYSDLSLHRGDDGSPLTCGGSTGLRYLFTPEPALAAGERTQCMVFTRGPDGEPWVAIDNKILRRVGGTYVSVPTPAEMEPIRAISAIRVDSDQTLWVSAIRKGLFSLRNGQWQRHPGGKNGLPVTAPLNMTLDRQSGLWLGYSGNQVVAMAKDQVQTFSARDGLRVGDVHILEAFGDGVLVAGSEGLAYIQDGRVRMLRGQGGEAFPSVTAIVDDVDGSHWLHGRGVLYRFSTAALRAATQQDELEPLSFERMDHLDGLRGHARTLWPLPTGMRSDDGRIWFSTSSGLFFLNTAILKSSRPAPRAELRRLLAEGQPVALNDGARLPIGTQRLQFDFSAVEIANPERVRFRYRLQGNHEDWQVTKTRSAGYTNLPPGRYQFQLAADQGDGVWSEPPVVLNFTIPPPFYRSAWFYTLCLLAAATLLGLLHRLRLRQLEARWRLQMSARAQERERIARDLHDTLLQSTQGLILGVQALAERTTDRTQRAGIEQVLRRADEALEEGRAKVLALRDEARRAGDLAQTLAGETGLAFSLQTNGRVRELKADVYDEVFHVAREALRNAAQHAPDSRVTMQLRYGEDAFELAVLDEGRGIDDDMLEAGGRPGHWGLAGMRERAAHIGGRLEIERRSEGGTRVALSVPASLAYRK